MANASLHIKRIQQELKDFQNNPSSSFHAEPLKEDLHIWHFTIKGPPETEFEGGIYHGKIELPFDYPMKPPSLYFFTPSGRYELNTKICLTITDYHPEHWNPGWTIKTMLKALISYFPEKEGVTGVGALEYSAEERKALSIQSRRWSCPSCGPIISIIQGEEEEKEQDEKKEQELKKVEEVEEATVEAAGNFEDVNQVQIEESKSDHPEVPSQDDSFIEIKKSKDIPTDYKDIDSKKENRKNSRISSQRNYVEVDLRNLESALLQHILYYEAKQSISYQKNVLNVEKENPPSATINENKAEDSKINNASNSENKLEDHINNLPDETFETTDENLPSDVLPEQDPKKEERDRIKKQVFYINILIALILVCTVLLFIMY